MNFLAHAYLSGENEELLVGNFIADFVKGKAALAAFNGGIAEGIHLHRSIDAYTDSHPVVALSKDRLRPKYRHYAAVIVDVYYDYFLARRWNDFHPSSLADFAKRVYDIVDRYLDAVPAAVQNFFPYMKGSNWLYSYASHDGIARALSGMARRTSYVSHMEEAVIDLKQNEPAFEKEFMEFFPQLRQHVERYLEGPPLHK